MPTSRLRSPNARATWAAEPGRGHQVAAAALVLIQVAFLAWTRLVQPDVIIDDAYIHFRVAKNFAEGRGFLYNEGEPTLATTSPLYAGLLGAAHFLTRIELPLLARLINFGADVGAALLALLLLRQMGLPLLFRHAVVLVIASEPFTMYHSAAGMEMSLFVFATLLIVSLAHAGHATAAGLLLGLIGWLRPEGAVVGVALLVALLAARRTGLLLRAVAAAAGSAALLAILLWLDCGTVVPLSVKIKSSAPWFVNHHAGNCAQFLSRALGELTFLYPLRRHYVIWGPGGEAVHMVLLCLLQVVLMTLGARGMWRAGLRTPALTLALWAAGHWLFYALANPFLFAWYMVPFLWVSLLLAGAGAWEMLVILTGRLGRGAEPPRLPPAGLVGNLAVVYLVLGLLTSAHRVGESPPIARGTAFRGETLPMRLAFRFQPLDREPERPEHDYIVAAGLLNDWIGEDNNLKVGLWEIGILGYLFEGKVLDSHGLVSPEVHDLLARRDIRADGPWVTYPPGEVFVELRPELVALPDFYRQLLPEDFDAMYTEVSVQDLDMIFFVRSDLHDAMADRLPS